MSAALRTPPRRPPTRPPIADRYAEDQARLEAFRAAVLAGERTDIAITWRRLQRWRRRLARVPRSGRRSPPLSTETV